MYVCGITVYDYLHLGHARFMVVFDMVRRWLRASGYRVTYVRNITDIDDKIIRRAGENGEPVDAVTARFIRAMDEDAAALGVEKPDHEPRATQYVREMRDMIRRLQEKKLAYQSASGDVNFAVRRFPGYGKLSGKSLDELRAGERVDVDATKEDPLDFVLWKRAKPGEPKWPSPWGDGRPGWHIECSAMGCTLLGEQFDIHGGGMDLQFPHHENEIAQSEGATGKPFVKYWMHNGFLRIDDEKMSKSLGNFLTIEEILKRLAPEAVRLFLVGTHYRSPLDFTEQGLADATRACTRIHETVARLEEALGETGAGTADLPESVRGYRDEFASAMDDDLNSPRALAAIFDEIREINRLLDAGERDGLAIALREAAEETGLTDLAPWPDAALRHVVIVPVPAARHEPAHEHADVRFLFATGAPETVRAERPDAPMRWLSLTEARELTGEDNLRETLSRVGHLLVS